MIQNKTRPYQIRLPVKAARELDRQGLSKSQVIKALLEIFLGIEPSSEFTVMVKQRLEKEVKK